MPIGYPWPLLTHVVAGVTSGLLAQIVLMVVLGTVPGRGWLDCRGDGPTPPPGAIHASLHSLGCFLLLSRLGKNGGAVLRSLVVALTIERRWIVQLEEPLLEQVFIADYGRVERDPYCLGVA